MAAIKSRDTNPELMVRRKLHSMGLRFRLHRKDLPGRPDIVLPKYKTVVLVHGCFWHQHPDCSLAHWPQSRKEYWEPKLNRNVARDIDNRAKLEQLGWRVITIWECESKNIEQVAERVAQILS